MKSCGIQKHSLESTEKARTRLSPGSNNKNHLSAFCGHHLFVNFIDRGLERTQKNAQKNFIRSLHYFVQ